MVLSAEERRLKKNATQNAKYKNNSVFRANKKAAAKGRYQDSSAVRARAIVTDRAWSKANRERRDASQAKYRAKPKSKAMQKKRSKDERMRYYEKNGYDRRDTKMNAILALIMSDFVGRFASNEEIFPDEREADNVHIRDRVMTGFRREAGLELKLESELDRGDANVRALLSLVDACKKKDPKAVAFRVVDTEYTIPDGGSVVTSMTECAAGTYNYQGVRIDEFSVVKESGVVVDEDDLDDLKTFLDENGEDTPLFCWGNAEQPLFRHLGLHHGVDAKMIFRKAFPALIQSMKSEGIGGDPKKIFSMSMNVMTAVFGMGIAHHTALKDCDGEAVVIAALGRYIAAEW